MKAGAPRHHLCGDAPASNTVTRTCRAPRQKMETSPARRQTMTRSKILPPCQDVLHERAEPPQTRIHVQPNKKHHRAETPHAAARQRVTGAFYICAASPKGKTPSQRMNRPKTLTPRQHFLAKWTETPSTGIHMQPHKKRHTAETACAAARQRGRALSHAMGPSKILFQRWHQHATTSSKKEDGATRK